MKVKIELTLPDEESYLLLTSKIVEIQMETNERLHPEWEVIKINETVNIDYWEKL